MGFIWNAIRNGHFWILRFGGIWAMWGTFFNFKQNICWFLFLIHEWWCPNRLIQAENDPNNAENGMVAGQCHSLVLHCRLGVNGYLNFTCPGRQMRDLITHSVVKETLLYQDNYHPNLFVSSADARHLIQHIGSEMFFHLFEELRLRMVFIRR